MFMLGFLSTLLAFGDRPPAETFASALRYHPLLQTAVCDNTSNNASLPAREWHPSAALNSASDDALSPASGQLRKGDFFRSDPATLSESPEHNSPHHQPPANAPL